MNKSLLKNSDGMDLEILYRDHYQSLRQYAEYLCHNTEDADDLTMETLARAAAYTNTWRREASPQTLLRRILKNLFLDRKRSGASRVASLDAEHESWDDYNLPTVLRGGDPAMIVAANMAAEHILSMSRYPDLLQNVALNGYSLPELSARDTVDLGTLTGRYQRDRKRLQRLLKENK